MKTKGREYNKHRKLKTKKTNKQQEKKTKKKVVNIMILFI